jgi:hypothetical protein
MKFSEAIGTVNRRKHNTVDDEDKFDWLNSLEGIIYENIFSRAEDTTFAYISRSYEIDQEKELSIPEPYTELYIHYLAARIDEDNGEFNSYNNNMVLYNNLYEEFAKYYRRNHMPKQIGAS